MLSGEEAQSRLASFTSDDWLDAAQRRARKLPRRLRPTAEALIVDLIRHRPHDDRDERHARHVRHGTLLDDMSSKDRAQVFGALHPKLGELLGDMWVDLQRRPYTVGYARRAFRSPNNTARTAPARFAKVQALLVVVGPYDQDVSWFASWAAHLWRGQPTSIGSLLATAIDAGGTTGDQVAAILVDTINGDDPVGVFGHHVIHGLLGASRPAGWDHVRRMLLAAQRQEGLRQSILEAADEGHPNAFRLLLDTIIDNDLLRFAASVRAVAVWLGLPADVEQIPLLTERVRFLREVITDTGACARALDQGDAWQVHIALCGVAMHDVDIALRWCAGLRHHPDRDVRAAVLGFMQATAVTDVRPWFVEALGDSDLDVAMSAARQIRWWPTDTLRVDPFNPLWELARRLPESPTAGDTIGTDLHPIERDRSFVVNSLLSHLGARTIDVMLPWVSSMDAQTRQNFARHLQDATRLTPEVRAVVFQLLGDRSSSVRDAVARFASRLTLDDTEAQHVEALLTRRSSDTRRTAIALLASQPTARSAESASRLWDTHNAAQRDAACELIASLPDRLRERILERWTTDGATDRQLELLGLSGSESTASEASADDAASGPATDLGPTSGPANDPGLGLLDPAKRMPISPPRKHSADTLRGPDAVLRCISALDDLAYEHRDEPVMVTNWQGTTEKLLGDVRWYPSPFGRRITSDSEEDEGSRLVLPELFRPWWLDRPDDLRAFPGIEIVQGLAAIWVARLGRWQGDNELLRMVATLVAGPVGEMRIDNLADHVMSWMLIEEADGPTVDHCLDALETSYAGVPRRWLQQVEIVTDDDHVRWRAARNLDWRNGLYRPWADILRTLRNHRPELFDQHRTERWYRIERFFDEPVTGARRHPVDQQLLLDAHRVGAATDDDIRDSFLAQGSPLLTEATRHRRTRLMEQHPRLIELADEMRDRIVTIERHRGELPTAATRSSFRIASVHGTTIATELLSRLGRANLVRGWTGGEGREAVYSRLLRVSQPATDDTPETLRAAAQAAKLTDKRLLELAVYAPQWVDLIEGALGWDGLAEAVWWIHSHTKDTRWTVSADVRDNWRVLSAERSPLSSEDLLDGAVDVEWFRRAHRQLGAERWAKLTPVAKLASGGNGHRRAQVFAEALLGVTEEATLIARIQDKRNQDAVRALGLLPVPDDSDSRMATALRRYGVMREFERGSAKFGNQRKASERLAVRIGVENLARTAGYVDPQRFIWSVEAAEAGDLAHGPVSVVDGEVTVTLSVDSEGLADITVDKAGKSLKNVPAALRKHPEISELRNRKTALTRQATRVRRSLEEAMIRQDHFEVTDLEALDRHPVLAPMLRLVLFVDGDGHIARWRGDRWVDADDRDVATDGDVRLAHPVDLLASGEWIRWQERLFVDATRQPFKQAFRELYLPTDGERTGGPGSRRYEGHQIQTRQATALFGARGWTIDREAGDVWRVFHQHGVTARVDFLDGFLTAAEVELPSITHIVFTRRSDATVLPLESVPPVVFSETMRDLDLVVSVAHAGGVDPEATASTVEMRTALAPETIRLMKLDNVRIDHQHLLIDGRLGEYSVHLGSGIVHRRPGGAVCIIPVAAQRRGRLFLPFADDDPKTAEIMSKLLLLARDHEIKDPSILGQLS